MRRKRGGEEEEEEKEEEDGWTLLVVKRTNESIEDSTTTLIPPTFNPSASRPIFALAQGSSNDPKSSIDIVSPDCSDTMASKTRDDVRVLDCEGSGSEVEILDDKELTEQAQESGQEERVDNEAMNKTMGYLARDVLGLDLGLDGIKFDISVRPHHASQAIPAIGLDCTHDEKVLGYISAHFIDKFMIQQSRGDFYSEMYAAGSDCRDLAITIFDKPGSIRIKWITDAGLKGSGIWKQTLSHGNLLVIEKVEVVVDYRRKGIGRKLVEGILKEARDGQAEHTFVWATELKSAPDASKTDDPNSEAVSRLTKPEQLHSGEL
jgi:hypothetical protein